MGLLGFGGTCAPFPAFSQTLPTLVYVSTFNAQTQGIGIGVDSAGNAYVVGNNVRGVLTTKLSPQGQVLWNASYSSKDFLEPLALTVDPSGNSYSAIADMNSFALTLLKYGPDGALSAQASPPSSVSTIGGIVYDSSTNHVYLATAYQFPSNVDIRLIEYDANFNPIGSPVFINDFPLDDVPESVAVDPIGNVYVGADQDNPHAPLPPFGIPAENFLVVKFSPRLTQQLTKFTLSFNPPMAFQHAIAADPLGNIYSAGDDTLLDGTTVAELVKTGSPSYTHIFESPLPSNPLVPNIASFEGVVADSQGNAYAAGYSFSFPNVGPAIGSSRLIKYAPDGTALWNITPFNADGFLLGNMVALDAQNNLYVAGELACSADASCPEIVVKYSQGQVPPSLSVSAGDMRLGFVNQPLPVPLSVLAQNQSSAPRSGVAVNFSISSAPANAAGQSVSPTSATTGSNGLASTNMTLGNVPEDYFVNAACPSCQASADQVTFHECAKLNVPYFNQGDATPWANDAYDDTSSSMAAQGCAVSSLAMLAQFYGVTTGADGKPVNPGNLNAWLENNNGYNPRHDVYWGKISDYTDGIIQAKASVQPYNSVTVGGAYSQAQLQNFIQQDLSQSLPVIAFVNNPTTGHPHFIVLASVCGIPSVIYAVNDPGNSGFSVWDSKGYVLYGVRRFFKP